MEKQIRERIQEGRAEAMYHGETRMRFEFDAHEIYFSNNGKGHLEYYTLCYRKFGYDNLSGPAALALAYLLKTL